jgi:hypothetical protein
MKSLSYALLVLEYNKFIMETENYLRVLLIVLAVCVLCALVYQITQERKRRMMLPIGFTALPFVALERDVAGNC